MVGKAESKRLPIVLQLDAATRRKLEASGKEIFMTGPVMGIIRTIPDHDKAEANRLPCRKGKRDLIKRGQTHHFMIDLLKLIFPVCPESSCQGGGALQWEREP